MSGLNNNFTKYNGTQNIYNEADKRRLYVLCKNRYSDEQYYMIWFSFFFLGIGIWAYINNFKPYDTVGVFMALSFIIFIVGLNVNRDRYELRQSLMKIDKYQNPKDLPRTTGWDTLFFPFRYLHWFFIKNNPKTWKDFKTNPDNLDGLNPICEEMDGILKKTRETDRLCYKVYSTVGILAVLGTVLRLHGIVKESNASGSVLIILYEMVFTMYTTWQLLFENLTYQKYRCSNFDTRGYGNDAYIDNQVKKRTAEELKKSGYNVQQPINNTILNATAPSTSAWGQLNSEFTLHNYYD